MKLRLHVDCEIDLPDVANPEGRTPAEVTAVAKDVLERVITQAMKGAGLSVVITPTTLPETTGKARS